jgi:hypothetical protein
MICKKGALISLGSDIIAWKFATVFLKKGAPIFETRKMAADSALYNKL